MGRITNLLKMRSERWAWIGQRAHDALGINKILPLEFIVSCDMGLETGIFFRENDVYSLEKKKRHRKDWSNEDLDRNLEGSKGKEIFERIRSEERKINLVCYRSLRQLELKEKQGNFRVLAAPIKLKRRFDNKIFFHQSLPGLKIRGIKGFVDFPGKYDFGEIEKKFSGAFVLQTAFSSSGINTFLVKSAEQYEFLKKHFAEEKLLFRKYVHGYSVNVNAVICGDDITFRTIVSWPSVQITGVRECSNFASSYCGNDFSIASRIDKKVMRKIVLITQKVGDWMARSGYRGIFGMDYLISGREVFPIEINPRLQNSTSLLTSLELEGASGADPLVSLHIAQFLIGQDKELDRMLSSVRQDGFMHPLKGSQVVLHNPLQESVVTGNLLPGLYRLENGTITFVRSEASLTRSVPENTFLICSGVLSPGYKVAPNAPLCKIETKRRVLQGNRKSLNREFSSIVRAVYRAIGLKKVPGSGMELELHSKAGFETMEKV